MHVTRGSSAFMRRFASAVMSRSDIVSGESYVPYSGNVDNLIGHCSQLPGSTSGEEAMTIRFSIVLMILVGIAIAYYGSWVRPLWSLGAALATVGIYVLLFRSSGGRGS